jgi:hypothetical protein
MNPFIIIGVALLAFGAVEEFMKPKEKKLEPTPKEKADPAPINPIERPAPATE